jgi:hypothetical protein
MTQKNNNFHEKTITYVYVPDEGIYGTIVSQGVWSSMIEYFDGGFKYIEEFVNDEFIVVDEIGIGYIYEDKDDNL